MREIDWSRCLKAMLGDNDPALEQVEQIARGAEGSLFTASDAPASRVFRHPLSSAPQDKAFSTKPPAELAQALRAKLPADLTDQQLVFLLWRCGADLLPEDALTPADPILPDFTAWNHLAARAALANCFRDGEVRPAFLLFQMGPVQEFIAQARSTRDLWSGSYLLSWLIAHALKAITDCVGPAAIVFPNLRGNGIFDALHQGFYERTGLWDAITAPHRDDVAAWKLTPTLPNRFLALVPDDCAEDLAKCAEEAIHKALKALSTPVWNWLAAKAEEAGADAGLADWQKRWDTQIQAFPQITWAIQPWTGLDFNTLEQYKSLPINQREATGDRKTPVQDLRTLLDFARGKNKDNPGLAWAAFYGLADAKLAARRNTREFPAWDSVNLDAAVKDSLSGKEEVIGNEALWKLLTSKQYEKLFTAPGHRYGAMNLVKRLWCRPHLLGDHPLALHQTLKLKKDDFDRTLRFDSVHDVAKDGYVAVLAMDGDEMGKWISGEKTPLLKDQIVGDCDPGLQDVHRLLTPAYHLQFSEALANFSIWKAEEIVNAYDGQLIYAGGDDVLAMLPADRAIDCARDLRNAFRKDYDGDHPPRLMPGCKGDVSVGIAIGHEKAPLQMLVQEAQKAEHRAKHDYHRAALAISLYKRSGEILQWGCNWEAKENIHPALALLQRLESLRKDQRGEGTPALSARFPYALARALAPYRLGDKENKEQTLPTATAKEIIMAEVKVVIRQQASELDEASQRELRDLCQAWCTQCEKLEDFIQPFLTEAFINRDRAEKGEDEQ